MKIPVLTKTLTPGYGFKTLSLAGVMAVLTGGFGFCLEQPDTGCRQHGVKPLCVGG